MASDVTKPLGSVVASLFNIYSLRNGFDDKSEFIHYLRRDRNGAGVHETISPRPLISRSDLQRSP